ncbi:MAG: SDR family NAD(P)-dependent oxidoreductase [Xanthobacteraceae bacterium]
MTQELAGKTALVTGASRGLGVHMALRLAEAGAMVAVNYASDQAAAGETVRRIEEAGGTAFAVQAKLGSEAAGKALAEAALAGFGERGAGPGLDILVNIGGGDYAPIAQVSEAGCSITRCRTTSRARSSLPRRFTNTSMISGASSISRRPGRG